MRVVVSDLGATVVVARPDRTGRFADIVLAHDTPAEYLESGAYLGATIGRWANRIAGARFELDGIGYPLDRNENGNLLHGGANGFHRARWDVIDDCGGLTLRLDSPEGDAGFPGNVTVQVRYTLDDDGTLTIDYTGRTDAPTPLNLTNHSYFNLNGRAGSDVRGHLLQIDADAFLEVDDALIPTGTADVTGTAFDFRHSAPIGARLDWPTGRARFDHCFVDARARGPARRTRLRSGKRARTDRVDRSAGPATLYGQLSRWPARERRHTLHATRGAVPGGGRLSGSGQHGRPERRRDPLSGRRLSTDHPVPGGRSCVAGAGQQPAFPAEPRTGRIPGTA